MPSCQADEAVGKSAVMTSQSNSAEFPQQLPNTICNLGSSELNIFLARTFAQRAKGLMFAESLADNEGMLFVYNSPRKMVFWMKNTKIPLDIIFLSSNLQIIEWIEGMQPGYGKSEYLLPRYEAKQLAQYALELNAGAIKKMGLKLGDKLEIPLTLLYSE